MMRYIAFFILFLSGGALLPAAAAEPVLKIGGDCTYPPFVYKDKDGEIKGFDVDIGKEIARRLGMKPERACVPFDGMLPGLLAGKYDVTIANLDATPERAKRVDFSIPYYRAPAAFIGLKSMAAHAPAEKGILAPRFLAGKTVGVLRASNLERYLREIYPGVNISRYDTMDDVLLDLKAGRIDVAFTDMAKADSDFLRQPGNQNYAVIKPLVTDYAVLGTGGAVALRKGNTELKDKINAVIEAMMADGTYEKINHKYWSFSVKP